MKKEKLQLNILNLIEVKKSFKQIEEHLTQFFQFTIRHEICEDIYTFQDSDACIGAMSELGSYLYDYGAETCEISVRLDFEKDCFQIRVKEL